jgi:THO complex subunit 2
MKTVADPTQALVSCWKESDFMHTKNAITVGLQVIKSFPAMDTNGRSVTAAVRGLKEVNDRNITADVQALANS